MTEDRSSAEDDSRRYSRNDSCTNESRSIIATAWKELKARIPEELGSAATRFAQQHPLMLACLTITVALSVLPFITFVAYAVVTLIVVGLFLLIVEGALLAVGFFVFFCSLLLSFIVAVGVSVVAAVTWTLINLLLSFIDKRR